MVRFCNKQESRELYVIFHKKKKVSFSYRWHRYEHRGHICGYKDEYMERGISICWKLDVEDNSQRSIKQIIFVSHLILLYVGNHYGIRKLSAHAAKHLFADEKETETTHYKISTSEVYPLLLFTIDRNNYFFANVGEEYFFFS